VLGLVSDDYLVSVVQFHCDVIVCDTRLTVPHVRELHLTIFSSIDQKSFVRSHVIFQIANYLFYF